MDAPHIVVHPPALDGSRRVTAGDETLGTAGHLEDVVEILRRSDLEGIDLDALDPETLDVEDGGLVEWQGGGPEDWPGLSEHPAR
ncbi:hypothetical protein ACFS5L_11835 [Streptomyces phyllanthi]|uniref:Uncharacterized protein n=1 Tax=Streptomyces phyllanthi TaxID=1803180 RepID=A0A5N8W001_9ACTN|nr:hypothetical protein [Streptomyces phyllanthi]MPY39618.1 hypothetical protein [Streptomyces phyllanthi]